MQSNIVKGTLGASDKPEIIEAKASQDINKNFSFSLKDSTGKEVSKIKYSIGQASLQDQIIWQGNRATAVQGRTFLILTLKITNDYDQGVRINSKDYVRLKVGGSNELFAPEINNDPVEVQAKSTKPTRIGFAIDDNNSDLTLIVGEIKGTKENILGNLTQAKVGQEVMVTFSDNSKKFFIIEYITIVDPSQTHILNDSEDKRITVYTCTGFLDSKRFVVIAIDKDKTAKAN